MIAACPNSNPCGSGASRLEPPHAPATQAEAETLAGRLATAIGSSRLRFLVVEPGQSSDEDGDDEGEAVSEEGWMVSVWFDGQDNALGYIRIAGNGGLFEPNWVNEASLYFDDVEAGDAAEFVAALRSELISGLSMFLSENGDED